MKLLKTLTLGLLAAVTTAGSASAAYTVMHVTGSTAFRTAASVAIVDALSGVSPTNGTSASKTVYAGYVTSGKNFANDSQAIFADGTIGSGGTASVVVETFWSGSLSGVVDLVAGTSQSQFIDDTNASVQSTLNGSPGITTANTSLTPSNYSGYVQVPAVFHTGTVEMAMSDSIKSTIASVLLTTSISNPPLGAYSTMAALAAAVKGNTVYEAGFDANSKSAVAVAPFKWVFEKNTSSTYASPTNMTQQQARALIKAGAEPQALWSGTTTNAGDLTNYYYLEGRNEDSGTRIGAFAESQITGGAAAAPLQYQYGDGKATTSPIQLYPITALNTEPQIVWNTTGHSGYASGGNVQFVLDIANNGNSFGTAFTTANGRASANTGASYFIGYLGLTDATAALTGGATELKYNGSSYSPLAVENGVYSFWTYEHCYRLSNSPFATLIDNIADCVYEVDADIAFNGTTVTHEFDGVDNYAVGSAGLFIQTMNVNNASRTEGQAATY